MFLLFSCSDKEDPIGKWDDIIKLSEKEVDFSAATDSVIITTQGTWWWVHSISLNGASYLYYDAPGVDLESDNYTIEEQEFTVERRNATTLFVKMNANTSNEERVLDITLEAGNYFDRVCIRQAGSVEITN
jgi:hypothetical protein